MTHPQSARCALRQPPQGGAASGLAKPVPRRLLAWPAPRPLVPYSVGAGLSMPTVSES